MINTSINVEVPNLGDFIIGYFTIEVDGRAKSNSNVKNQMEHLVAAADIETGFGKMIPIWMFGILF